MAWSEEEVIVNLSEIFAEANSDVLVGIGDDAAVVARPKSSLVVTTDMAVQDIHFKTEWSSAKEIGRKVAAANLADLVAMGGVAKYLVVALAATGNEDLNFILDIAKGIAEEARILEAQVIGGDLSRAKELVITITAFGECEKPTTRSGARVGDGIYLSNLTGWSAAGLALLKAGKSGSELEDFAIAEHKSPSVDYENGAALSKLATSMCDVSDSVMVQGAQLAESSGVCFEFNGQLIKELVDFSELETIANNLNLSVWDFVMSGGEDHAFLATGKDLPFLKIGEVISGSGVKVKEMPAINPGWHHFN